MQFLGLGAYCHSEGGDKSILLTDISIGQFGTCFSFQNPGFRFFGSLLFERLDLLLEYHNFDKVKKIIYVQYLMEHKCRINLCKQPVTFLVNTSHLSHSFIINATVSMK